MGGAKALTSSATYCVFNKPRAGGAKGSGGGGGSGKGNGKGKGNKGGKGGAMGGQN